MLDLESQPQVTSLSTQFMHERGGTPQLDKYQIKCGEPAGHNHAPCYQLSECKFLVKSKIELAGCKIGACMYVCK